MITVSKAGSRYCIFQVQVMLEGWFIVKSVVVAAPDPRTLPVPFHPVRAYYVIMEPSTGENTEACMGVPALNQPVVGWGKP